MWRNSFLIFNFLGMGVKERALKKNWGSVGEDKKKRWKDAKDADQCWCSASTCIPKNRLQSGQKRLWLKELATRWRYISQLLLVLSLVQRLSPMWGTLKKNNLLSQMRYFLLSLLILVCWLDQIKWKQSGLKTRTQWKWTKVQQVQRLQCFKSKWGVIVCRK